jgi:hypothetical protein
VIGGKGGVRQSFATTFGHLEKLVVLELSVGVSNLQEILSTSLRVSKCLRRLIFGSSDVYNVATTIGYLDVLSC